MRLYITPTESISVSEHNVKLGEGVIAFSVPSIITCPKNAPCYKGCYAASLEHLRPTLRNSLMDNLDALLKHPKEVEKKLIAFIKLVNPVKFRWNVDGDVEVDPNRPMLYIDMMMRIAKKFPKIPFIVYSKSDLWTGLKRPKNLHYLNSLWKDWRNNNHDLCPCTNILEEGESTEGKIICPNQLNPNVTCRTCPLCSGGLKPGEIVYFKAHGRNKKKV